MFSFFTKRKQGEEHPVFTAARGFARHLGHNFVSAEHILLGVIECGGPAKEVLESYGVDATKGFEAVLYYVGEGSDKSIPESGPPITPRAKRINTVASEEARRLSSQNVRPEHFLLAVLRDPENVAVHILQMKFKMDLRELARKIELRAA